MKSKRQAVIVTVGFVAAVAAARTIPVALAGLKVDPWLDHERVAQEQFARGVQRLVLQTDLTRGAFHTGSEQFNGEWLFGTYLMAGIGYCQLAMTHPETRDTYADLSRSCISNMLSDAVRTFDREMWREDPIDGIDGPNAHAAFLGYFNLLLGMHREAFGDETYAELNDRITKALIRHLHANRIGLLESYPSEVYPVDNCFVIGSIGVHERVTGHDHQGTIERWTRVVRARYLDQASGLLIQAVDPVDGTAIDAPRGSGTALGLFAVHHADAQLAANLYAGLKRSAADTWLGFGAVREYPTGHAGMGDIDSGPVVFGFGVSPTGFALAGAQRYGDREYAERLIATTVLCGVPRHRGDTFEFITGGPLGNAILFAMVTAPPVGPAGEAP